LLPPADAQLDVERTIFIIDTFQSIRTISHCWCDRRKRRAGGFLFSLAAGAMGTEVPTWKKQLEPRKTRERTKENPLRHQHGSPAG
jgi:hypothetical protein